jgi:hypothetical protein
MTTVVDTQLASEPKLLEKVAENDEKNQEKGKKNRNARIAGIKHTCNSL